MSDAAAALPLLLRGVRWRLGASILTVLTATIAVATAVLGPMYLYTGGDSVLRQTVASSPVQSRGLTLISAPNQSNPLPGIQRAERDAQTVHADGRSLYGPAITTLSSGVGIFSNKSQLFWRTGICQVLRFEQGACHLGPGQVAMSARSAHSLGVKLGQVLAVRVTGRAAPMRMRVTGLFATPNFNAPYWWGDGPAYFPFGSSFSATGSTETDSLIASPATVLGVPAADVPSATGQLDLRPNSVTLANEQTVRHALAGLTAHLKTRGIRAGTRLNVLLATADHQRHSMSTIVAIAATQLVLLAIWVLGGLLLRSSEARRSEARVARLRGFSPRSMLWVTGAEPACLCLLGAVLGVGVAWLAMLLARSEVLDPAAAIHFDVWAFAALALTILAIGGALVLSAARLLSSANLAGSSASTSAIKSGPSWSRVGDAVLIVLAIVGLVALGTSGALNGHSNPLASAAPGLIALGVAAIAVQITLVLCQLGIPVTAGSRWTGSFLALCQTSRRPGLLRQARVLVVALCLACFAASAWSIARTNRATAAAFATGATTVVTVGPHSAAALQQAVSQADPKGRFAMAAIDLRTPSATLLAVDSSRLTKVASWPNGISRRTLSGIVRVMHPPTHSAIQVPSEPLRVAVHTTSVIPHADLDLGAWVFNGTTGTTVINLGRLRPGDRVYGGSLAGVCGGGCELAGLGVYPAPGRPLPSTGEVRLSVSRLWSQPPGGAARPLSADLVPGGWRPATPDVSTQVGPHLLSLSANAVAINSEGASVGAVTEPMASPADHPAVVPAVATPVDVALNSDQTGPLPTQGLDGNTIRVAPSALSTALPRVGSDALMVDLGFLSHVQQDPISPDATDQVWLGPSAPADALARLRRAGLQPLSVERSSAAFNRLEHTGPALADDFLLVATIAALLMAAAATLGTLGATTRDRATELTSMEVAGVPRPVLVRALLLESVVLMVTALCGVGAGVIAAWLAIPSLPELAAASLAPLSYGLPIGLIVIVTAAVLAAVALASTSVASALLHRMSPSLLRTAPDDVTA